MYVVLNIYVCCPSFLLLASQEEEEIRGSSHFTVAQQKARSIMESFENPFRMVHPTEYLSIKIYLVILSLLRIISAFLFIVFAFKGYSHLEKCEIRPFFKDL